MGASWKLITFFNKEDTLLAFSLALLLKTNLALANSDFSISGLVLQCLLSSNTFVSLYFPSWSSYKAQPKVNSQTLGNVSQHNGQYLNNVTSQNMGFLAWLRALHRITHQSHPCKGLICFHHSEDSYEVHSAFKLHLQGWLMSAAVRPWIHTYKKATAPSETGCWYHHDIPKWQLHPPPS